MACPAHRSRRDPDRPCGSAGGDVVDGARPAHPLGAARGFTLVELMVIVVIVGVLAMLAVLSYRRLIGSSHIAEATGMVQSIRAAQEQYYADGDHNYLNLSTALAYSNQNLQYAYPHNCSGGTNPGPFKVQWGCACTAGACRTVNSVQLGWNQLQVHADGPVMYGFTTIAGSAGTQPSPGAISINGSTVTWPASANVTQDWFIVTAVGDTDGNGVYSTVLASSFGPDVLVDKEGE